MLTKDMAICIRAVDYSETSQIVTLFTRATGKIGAIAKGSKRPRSSFGGPIEIFSHGKIVFSDPNREKLATLTELESVYGGRGINGLGKNLFALNCCLFGAELLDKFTHNYDPHPQLFDGFLEFLQNTHNAEKNSEILALLILFQLTLLKEVGLQPVLNSCVNCKTKYEMRDTRYGVYFCSSANGLICRDCEGSFPDKVSLSRAAANCLSNLKLLEVSNEKTLKEIEGILIHHFTELLGHKPKMAKHVLK
ncbi:MAG: DNA repair protein RecO [Phycisphaerales bacterium]|jgi:DNA repair protein RecO (recombination protein O)